MEKDSRRRIERSMMQLQSLLDDVNNNKCPVNYRLSNFYCTVFPQIWNLERELANVLLSLGVSKEALEIYERLQLWEDVVVCYTQIGRRDKAAKLIQKQLDKQETPLWWCLLGDATDNPECYKKAWALSNNRSSLAQKKLGFYHYQRKEYEDAIPYLQKSLSINSLQLEVWMALGFSSLQISDYEVAAKAYNRIVSLDPDNFAAWNNLSNAYIRLQKKHHAWKALREALKYAYEDWKVWENYLLVSVDIGAFDEAIFAYQRLIDIKEKHVDEEVLSILLKAIVNDVKDSDNNPGSNCQKKLNELFGRLTSVCPTNAIMWSLYADLLLHKRDPTDLVLLSRAIQCRQKSIKNITQKNNWERDFKECKLTLENGVKLADATKQYFIISGSNQESIQLLSSCKLMLKNIAVAVRNVVEGFTDGRTELQELLTALKYSTASITEMSN